VKVTGRQKRPRNVPKASQNAADLVSTDQQRTLLADEEHWFDVYNELTLGYDFKNLKKRCKISSSFITPTMQHRWHIHIKRRHKHTEIRTHKIKYRIFRRSY